MGSPQPARADYGHRALAERRVLVDPAQAEIDAPPGTVVGGVEHLERAVVDELP